MSWVNCKLEIFCKCTFQIGFISCNFNYMLLVLVFDLGPEMLAIALRYFIGLLTSLKAAQMTFCLLHRISVKDY